MSSTTQYALSNSYSLDELTIELPSQVPDSQNNGQNSLMFNIMKNSEFRSQSSNQGISLYLILKELVIFHNILETTNSGYLVVVDKGNLLQSAPLVGWERLHIKFSMPNSKQDASNQEPTKTAGSSEKHSSPYEIYDRYFYIYAVDSMRDSTDVKTYTIRFTSLVTLINLATRIEKRYVGKAEDILNEITSINAFKSENMPAYLSTVAREFTSGSIISIDNKLSGGTEFEHDVVCPSWRPLSFMRHIVEKSVSAGGVFTDCLLFQQTDGKYTLTSYRDMISNQESIEFKYSPFADNIDSHSSGYPEVKDKYTIKNYTMEKSFNTQEQCAKGMTGGLVKIIDAAAGVQQDFALYYKEMPINNIVFNEKNFNSPSSLVQVEDTEFNTITAGAQVTDAINLNINSISGIYNMSGESSLYDNMLTAMKQGPMEKIRVKFFGFDQTSFEKNRKSATGIGAQIEPTRKDEIQRSVAMNETAKHIMHLSEVIFEMNPCTDLRLGQQVKIEMESDDTSSRPMINGVWYIGKIKYVLTYTDIKVFVTCFRSSTQVV